MSKPAVFNYQDYVNLKRDYAELLVRCDELEREVMKLKSDKANLEIRCRILQADRSETNG